MFGFIGDVESGNVLHGQHAVLHITITMPRLTSLPSITHLSTTGEVTPASPPGVDTNVETRERLAGSRSLWRGTLREYLKSGEQKLINEAEDRRLRRKEHAYSVSSNSVSSNICDRWYSNCHSRIGLFSHRRRCRRWGRDAWSIVKHDWRRPTEDVW